VAERDPWATLISVAGAAGAAAGIVYLAGGVVLSLRYEGLGLSGQQAVGLTPREVLLFAGARSLLLWWLVGLAVVLLLLRFVPRLGGVRVRRAPVLAVLIAAVLAGLLLLLLLLLLRVWWPLATLVALTVLVVAVARWRGRPVLLFVVSAAAISLIAVSVEADRLSYKVDRVCVGLLAGGATAAEPRAPAPALAVGRRCGVLVGQSDRGFYVGAIARRGTSQLVFVPADRVAGAASTKVLIRVVPSYASARRERLVSRLLGTEIR
jgi:hypothetical protein